MKKILPKTFLVFLFLFVSLRCNESRLNVIPPSITEANYFTEVGHFERAVRGIYAGLTYLYEYNYRQELIAHQIRLLPGDDITFEVYNNGKTNEFEIFKGLRPDNDALGYLFEYHYMIVNRALILLEKLETIPDEVYYDNPKLKDHHKGEALFLKSLMNFRIYNHWGNHAPLLNKRINTIEGTYLEMSGGTKLLDQAIEDLMLASELLPKKWPAELRGRATKNSANGLLGKTYICRANYSSNNQDYQKALDVFEKLEGLKLVEDFGANFDPLQENNEESLFEFQASVPPSLSTNIWATNDSGSPEDDLTCYWGFFNNDVSMYSYYPYMPTNKLIKSFHNQDPRFSEIFKEDSIGSLTGYTFQKYVKRGHNKPAITHGASINNPRILRYADILLLKAEALLKTGNAKQAIQAINEVRTRARNMVEGGIVPANFPAGETEVKVIMQWIMDERFRELCAEDGIRWQDLKRWHAAGDIDLSTWGPEEFGTVRDDFGFDINKHLLWPIPHSDILKNPKLQQNPGY